MNEETQQAEYNAWLETRPAAVREIAKRFRPWKLLRFKDTKRPCELHSFEEPIEGGKITLKVVAPQIFGPDHLVFGVDPDNIEEIPEP